MREHHIADCVGSEQAPKRDGQRLVVIVFSHQNDALCRVLCFLHRAIVVECEKGRLLDEHVLARSERTQREVEVKARRNGDDNGLDAGVVDGRRIFCVASASLKAATVVFGTCAVATGVAADDLVPQALQMAAVHVRDEAASEEREPQRFGHSLEL